VPHTEAEPHVALLKGVNVGRRHPVPMATLREALDAAGFTEVRTYIQSGNVIFRDTPVAGSDPATAIAGSVAATFGFDIAVVCRSRSELVTVLERDPLLRDEDDPTKLHVAFLNAAPDADRAAQLDPDRSPPDRFVLLERELSLHYPHGAACTKLTGHYLERTLHRTATIRNVKTVRKLVELMAPP
jgi:uncharacterized protein (DUF1697 family)